MSQLEIFRQGEKVLGLSLDKNVIRVGRASPSEIELPDPSLSREHCLLVRKDASWYLEDNSKNGVRLANGENLQNRILVEPNQRYKIGRIFSFELKSDRESNKDRTLVVATAPTQLVKMDKKAKKITLGRASIFGKFGDGTPFHREIRAEGLTIGCHDENELKLVAPEVSQFHARIDLIDNVYVFSDLSSTNGSAVNETRIFKAPLSNGSKVRVGPFELQFEIKTEEHAIKPKNANRFFDMVSQNKQMKTVFTTIEVVAPTDAAVFIHGRTGTGKELVAKALHQLSRRESSPFIAINCAALPKDLVESELFGHEKGAFTGASSTQIGAFEAAHQGTLFLDEVAELDLTIQAKLLRALEAKEIKRLGSNNSIAVSLRIVSASHKNLLEEVHRGTFREDLFYRLHIVQIEIPPLVDRLEDIELLTEEFFRQLHLDFTLDPKALDFLKTYAFPGNIRELKNVLQRAAIEFEVRSIAQNRQLKKVLCVSDFHFLRTTSTAFLSQSQLAEKDAMSLALRRHDFVQVRAAKDLGIPVSTLNDKIKRYAIPMY